MTDQEIYKAFESNGAADYTNRLIPGDENFDYPEWQEFGAIDNIPVVVYYRTTPEDAELAKEQDWGSINWENRISRICLDDYRCSNDGIDPANARAMCDHYGIEFVDFA